MWNHGTPSTDNLTPALFSERFAMLSNRWPTPRKKVPTLNPGDIVQVALQGDATSLSTGR
jgi:hypothetical protein